MDPIPLLCWFTGRYMNIGQQQKHPQQLIVLNPNVHERIAKGRLQHFPASNLNRRSFWWKRFPSQNPCIFFLGFTLKQPKHTIFMFHAFVLDHLFPYQMVRNKELQQGQGGSHQPDRYTKTLVRGTTTNRNHGGH